MRLMLIILTLFLITSCSNYTYQSISGEYRTTGGFESFSSINLSLDSTFSYEYQAGLLGGKTEGKWFLNGNKIILNSLKQPDKDSIIVIESYNVDQTDIKIKIMTKSGDPLGAALVILNGDTLDIKTCNDHGVVNIKEQIRLKDLTILYLGEKYTCKTNNEESNIFDIKVTFDPLYQSYRFFSNETWFIRKGNLIDNLSNYKKKGNVLQHKNKQHAVEH